MAKGPLSRFGRSAIGGVLSVERHHTIIAGDTLPKICAYYEPNLGYSAEYWRQVAEANAIDDLDELDIGTVITVPSPEPVE